MKKNNSKKIKTVFFLIFILIGSLGLGLLGAVIEANILRIPIIAYTFGYSFLIVLFLIYYKNQVNKKAPLIEAIASILMAFFMFMTIFAAYKTYKIASETFQMGSEANKPQLTVQVSIEEILWNRGPVLVESFLSEDQKKAYSIDIPIHISINNWGSVNTQIYVIYWNSTCTDDAGYFDIPSNEKSLIKPGEFFSLNETINIDDGSGKTIEEIVPCNIEFKISGPNFKDIKQVIILKTEI